MADEGQFPKTDGDVLYASEVNNFYNRNYKQIYTGAAFNTSATGDTGETPVTQENSYEFSAIPADDLIGMNYVIIEFTGTAQLMGSTPSDDYVQIKVQTKEVGGSYSDSLAYTDVLKVVSTTNMNFKSSQTFRYVHTLTSGEKTNGVQIKVFSKSSSNTHTAVCSYTNIQTSLITI